MYAYNRILRSLSALLMLMLLPVAALAATITGTVTNRTNNRPAAGDVVTLMQQGMTELAHATTDAKGQFSLDTPAGGPYLLRVTHDMATYYKSATAGQPVDVDVYSAGAHVAGVTTEVLMLRAQTDVSGGTLNVTEDFVVKNASQPAMTQYSKSPFDVYLPPGAIVEATAAKGPNGMPTAEDLTPQGDKGQYSVMFPIKPGETQIEIAYHLPYTGSLKMNLKLAGQTDMFAVSLPKSMTFTPTSEGQFIPANGDASASTYLVRNVKPGQMVGFAIGGSGQLPRDTQASEQGGQPGAAAGGADGNAGAPADDAPGKGLGNPLDPNGTREPVSTKYKWWIIGGLGLLLVAAAGVLLRKPVVAPVVGAAASQDVLNPVSARAVVASSLPVAQTAAGQHAQLMHVLKEELFGLETDRLQGLVSEADYLQSKAAIELILRRALQRGAVAASVPPTGSVS